MQNAVGLYVIRASGVQSAVFSIHLISSKYSRGSIANNTDTNAF